MGRYRETGVWPEQKQYNDFSNCQEKNQWGDFQILVRRRGTPGSLDAAAAAPVARFHIRLGSYGSSPFVVMSG